MSLFSTEAKRSDQEAFLGYSTSGFGRAGGDISPMIREAEAAAQSRANFETTPDGGLHAKQANKPYSPYEDAMAMVNKYLSDPEAAERAKYDQAAMQAGPTATKDYLSEAKAAIQTGRDKTRGEVYFDRICAQIKEAEMEYKHIQDRLAKLIELRSVLQDNARMQEAVALARDLGV